MAWIALTATSSLLIATAHAQSRPVITLQEALLRARERSSEQRALKERIVEAELNVRRAWALLLPQWSANYSYTHIAPSPPPIEFPEPIDLSMPGIRDNCVTGGDAQDCITALVDELQRVSNAPPRRLDFARADTHQIGTRVVWNLFTPQALPLIQNAYDAEVLERRRSTSRERELLLLVARAYYGAAATRQAIEAARRSEDRALRQKALVDSRAELGEHSGAVVDASQIAAEQAALDLARAKNAHERALLALALLTSSDERPDIVPPPPPDRPPGDPDTLLAAALAQKPELEAAHVAVTIAERTETAAWWSFAPTVGLFGGFRWSNVPGLTLRKDQWSVGLAASLTLFDGGLRYADLDSARSKIRSARLALDGVQAKVSAEVERMTLELDSAELSIRRAAEAKKLAEHNLALAEARLEVGALRSDEMEDAHDRLRDAELGVIYAKMERDLAVLELRHAVGVPP